MHCSNCGASVNPTAKFCVGCGRPIAVTLVPGVPKKKTHPLVMIMAGLFIVFFALVLFGMLINAIVGNQPASTAQTTIAPQASPSPTPKLTKAQQRAEDIAVRKAYAKVIDKQLIELGIESETYTTGADATTMVIKDALAGRVRANSIEKADTMFQQMRVLGFKKLEYENGFEGDMYFGWHWDLTKP